jgi:hypothetical protein
MTTIMNFARFGLLLVSLISGMSLAAIARLQTTSTSLRRHLFLDQNDISQSAAPLPSANKDESKRDDQQRVLTATNTARSSDMPFTASPFEATTYFENGEQVLGDCDREGMDAQHNFDPICNLVDDCHLGWTESGEYFAFEFVVNEDDLTWDWYNWEAVLWVDVTLRVASNNPNRRLQLEIRNDLDDSSGNWPTKTFQTPGSGWQTFQDISWSNVPLRMDASKHVLEVTFLDGSVNWCSVKVNKPRIAPFRAPALEFNDYHEVDSDRNGNCGNGLVDAQRNRDFICQYRDGSNCNVGWTRQGEWIAYDFSTVDSEDYDVWARIASRAPGKRVRLELETRGNPSFDPLEYVQSSYEYEAPGLGWQAFVDVGFHIYLGDGNYRFKVSFEDGFVNLCSVGVDFMAQWAVGEFEYPIAFNALDYNLGIDSNENHQGNCPTETSVDSKISEDPECLATGPCHVAYTRRGEILRYDFSAPIDFSNREDPGPVVNVIFRVASTRSANRILVELDGNRRMFSTPGNGWDSFENIVWENVQLHHDFYHPLYVVFVDGQVNLCSVRIAQ